MLAKKQAVLVLAWGALLLLSLAVTSQAEMKVSTKTETGLFRNYGNHLGHMIGQDQISLIREAAKETYMLQYTRCLDPIHQKNKTTVGDGDTGLGFSLVSMGGVGWYCNNTIEVVVNGGITTRLLLADYQVAADPKQPLAGFNWNGEEVNITGVFSAREDKPGLFAEISCEPKIKLTSLQITFACYPGAYTAPGKIASERWVVTSSGQEATVKSSLSVSAVEAENGKWQQTDPAKTLTLTMPGDSWVLYADKVLDPATDKRSAGPCGLVFIPGAIKGGSVIVGGYGIATSLDLPPEGGRYRLILFDFPSWPNDRALNFLKQESGSLKETLASIDFDIISRIRPNIAKTLSSSRAELEQVNAKNLDESEKKELADLKKEASDLGENLKRKDISFKDLTLLQQQADDLSKKKTEFAYKMLVK